MSEINTTNEPVEAEADAEPAAPERVGPRQRLKQRAERGALLQHQARRARQRAGTPSVADPAQIERCEQEAIELLPPPEPLQPGAGGEIELSGSLEELYPGLAAQVASAPGAIEADASLERLELLREARCVSLGLEAATSEGEGSVERMLAHQLAAAHRLAMRFVAKSEQQLSQVVGWQDEPRQQMHSIEAARLAGASARLMEACQKGALVLDRRRHGGRQAITVQHVHVGAGGQAVVAGSLKGARRRRGGG